jgi:hypothetical protein
MQNLLLFLERIHSIFSAQNPRRQDIISMELCQTGDTEEIHGSWYRPTNGWEDVQNVTLFHIKPPPLPPGSVFNMQRESTPLAWLRASVEQAGVTDRVGSSIKMFTSAKRQQITHITINQRVSLHGVYFVIKEPTLIFIIPGKSLPSVYRLCSAAKLNLSDHKLML